MLEPIIFSFYSGAAAKQSDADEIEDNLHSFLQTEVMLSIELLLVFNARQYFCYNSFTTVLTCH